ncbi:MAG: endonuclease/exonuclease/phosphatase family protein [Bacteroidia bacterium]
MRKTIFILFTIWLNLSLAQTTLPKLGNDTLLDVACWNIEWFGDVSNGPTDEVTQYNSVKRVLEQTGIDVWGLCEVSNNSTFSTLLSDLSSIYSGVNSTFSATQKMALLYKNSMFTLIPSLTFNIPVNSSQNFQFASRPPLQVALQTKGGTRTDTLFFLVVHLKALSDQDSYNRRVASSAILKSYVETNLAGKKFMIIGDWNDMLRFSTFNQNTTPFKIFLDDNYLFISKRLEEAGRRSYAFSASFIDHIMLSKNVDSLYIQNSSNVWDNAGTFISNFSNNTSDHYPVWGFFDWKKLTTLPKVDTPTTSVKSFNEEYFINLFPNPVINQISITTNLPYWKASIYNSFGTIIKEFDSENIENDISNLSIGVYYIQITANNYSAYKMFVKQ